MRANRLLFGVPVVLAIVALVLRMQLADAHTPYRVQEGDTLSQVAERLGVSIQALASANGISDPDFIVNGQMLVVPDDGGYATEYLVRKGDTLAGISSQVGVPMGDIMKVNGLDDANLVPAGKLLSIPPVGSTVTGPITFTSAAGGRGGTYKVKAGDNLSSIAQSFGVSVTSLAAANGISDPNLIVEGQVITAPGGGGWLCPVPSASFSNDYGYAEEGGGKHNGVDLFAVKGAPIQAPVSGTVERYPNNAGGNALHLWGNDGNRYYLAHLSAYGEGGTVSAGDIIGYVGNTGDAATTSPHLHFEIHPHDGPAVNPFPTLVAACR